MKIDINEWLTYAMILTFVIGLLYLGFYVIGDKEELKEGEVVEGEKEIKEEILEDIEDIEDELNEIGDFIG